MPVGIRGGAGDLGQFRTRLRQGIGQLTLGLRCLARIGLLDVRAPVVERDQVGFRLGDLGLGFQSVVFRFARGGDLLTAGQLLLLAGNLGIDLALFEGSFLRVVIAHRYQTVFERSIKRSLLPVQTVLEQRELGVQLRFHQRGLRAGRVLRWLDGFGLGQALKQFRIGLDLGCLDLDGLGVEQAVTKGRQFIQPFDQIALEVGNDGLGPIGVALERLDRRRHTGTNGLAHGDEGLANGGGTQCQGLEHQHHAIQDRAQCAALLGRLDHATGHIVQGGQQGRDDLVANALGGQFQLVEGIVEVARLRRCFAAHLHAERLHLGSQLVDAVASLIQERDQLGSRLAEQLHCQRGFFRAVGHGFEAFGQIKQHLIGGTQGAVLVLELDTDGGESARGIFRPGRGF